MSTCRPTNEMRPRCSRLLCRDIFKGEEEVFESPPFTVTEGMDPKSKAVPFKLDASLGSVATG